MPRSTKLFRLAATAAFAAASLPACVSSSERWDALGAPEDFRRWKLCIEDYSGKWWAREVLGDVSDPEIAAMPRYTEDQAFAAILTLCRVHAATPSWASLPPNRHRRMVRDARARFDRIRAQVRAEAFESIISVNDRFDLGPRRIGRGLGHEGRGARRYAGPRRPSGERLSISGRGAGGRGSCAGKPMRSIAPPNGIAGARHVLTAPG